MCTTLAFKLNRTNSLPLLGFPLQGVAVEFFPHGPEVGTVDTLGVQGLAVGQLEGKVRVEAHHLRA